jgi:hypothetical protein
MKQLTILIMLLTVFSITACRKKHTVTIQAHNLVNPADGSHYAGMNYVILERGYFFNHKSNKIAYGQLDENGRAVIDVKLKKSLDYVLGIGTPTNVCYTEVELEYPINYKADNNINFNYAPCGWVNVPTNNVNCEGNNDTLRYKFYYTKDLNVYIYKGFTHGDGLSWDLNSGTPGCLNNPGFYIQIPSGDYTIEWEVNRPSGTTTGIDYFTVAENDTTTYVLEY